MVQATVGGLGRFEGGDIDMESERPDGPNVEWKDGPAEPGPRVYTVKELPLNVRVAQAVAQAIGWKLIPGEEAEGWRCLDGGTQVWVNPHGDGETYCAKCELLPEYVYDWSATGPLIQEHQIALRPLDELGKTRWYAEKVMGRGMGRARCWPR
jgi:hypothetical protein